MTRAEMDCNCTGINAVSEDAKSIPYLANYAFPKTPVGSPTRTSPDCHKPKKTESLAHGQWAVNGLLTFKTAQNVDSIPIRKKLTEDVSSRDL